MNKPQSCNPYLLRNTLLQLRTEAQHAELVRLRCDVRLQKHFWQQQRQQLQQDNQLLLMSLFQLGASHAGTEMQLQQLTQSSERDVLTQTFNRSIMLDRIQQAISLAKRQQSIFALLFIDLNKFKPINDQYGHAAGDAVLQQVSSRLNRAVRDSDAVSRHGGDEFLLLLNNISSQQDASAFATKLGEILAQPYLLKQGNVMLSASIGVACYPDDATNPQALIRHADTAMYLAKQQGKGNIQQSG